MGSWFIVSHEKETVPYIPFIKYRVTSDPFNHFLINNPLFFTFIWNSSRWELLQRLYRNGDEEKKG